MDLSIPWSFLYERQCLKSNPFPRICPRREGSQGAEAFLLECEVYVQRFRTRAGSLRVVLCLPDSLLRPPHTSQWTRCSQSAPRTATVGTRNTQSGWMADPWVPVLGQGQLGDRNPGRQIWPVTHGDGVRTGNEFKKGDGAKQYSHSG